MGHVARSKTEYASDGLAIAQQIDRPFAIDPRESPAQLAQLHPPIGLNTFDNRADLILVGRDGDRLGGAIAPGNHKNQITGLVLIPGQPQSLGTSD